MSKGRDRGTRRTAAQNHAQGEAQRGDLCRTARRTVRFGGVRERRLLCLPLLFIFQRKELRHDAAVPLGQKRVLTPRIFPLLDGHDLEELLPERPVVQLFALGQSGLEAVDLRYAGASVGVQQQLPVGTVINKETLVGVPLAEVAAQQGQYPVFRLDLRAQHAVAIRKPHEPAQLFHLAVDVPDGLVQRIANGIGQITHEAGTFSQQLANKRVYVQLLVRQTGEEAAPHHGQCLGGAAGNAAADPLAVCRLGDDRAHLE